MNPRTFGSLHRRDRTISASTRRVQEGPLQTFETLPSGFLGSGREIKDFDRDPAIVAGIYESLHDGPEIDIAHAGAAQIHILCVEVPCMGACRRINSGTVVPISPLWAFTSMWSLKLGWSTWSISTLA